MATQFKKPQGSVVAPRKGEADLAAIVEMMGKVSGSKTFKLPQNGTTRIRIVNPVGSRLPIQPAFEHWVPVIDDKGEPRKKLVICPKSHGRLEPCPICTLLPLLNSSTVPELKSLGGDMRQNSRFVVYLIDRAYMIPMAQMKQKLIAIPDQERIFDAKLPKMVVDKIMESLSDSLWGDCFSATNGYDWRITGGKQGGATFVKYEVTPIPREHSPAYDPMLASGLKPLADLAPVTPMDDIIEYINTQLQFVGSVGGQEGDSLIDTFLETWKNESAEAESIEVQGSSEEVEEAPEEELEGGDEDGSDESAEGTNGSDQEEENQETEGTVEEEEPEPEPEEEEEEAPKKPAPKIAGRTATPAAAPVKAARKSPAESTAEKAEAAKSKDTNASMPSSFAAKLKGLRGGK